MIDITESVTALSFGKYRSLSWRPKYSEDFVDGYYVKPVVMPDGKTVICKDCGKKVTYNSSRLGHTICGECFKKYLRYRQTDGGQLRLTATAYKSSCCRK